ncbi:short-chain type dehydrogenase [Companilactobacillus paralimentarius DSM 13238 = JCM 10415]|uniref:Short-chain type dehydrogenase n=1 Tax=Companilactobacillus paralimentarius DSM 13238 = JCM 10415 TaxID=1122151 RepID=A0A0R1PN22_9LACO|nr:SDR family NAD(P)-dependent oxidoreductase [Companilactobacillus paralimentarius]KAE9563379.1 short-chain dehydrogenase [Companilactobacillus paralimentarius]KRL31317.1 short-chain type dehydrogenase [Companilactobacillus paralimentarius DSM 13238 = JCM 10415]QFR69116.1 SDR family NAD(P)-dependent oxidoreductase [Companilactobacillus paralimentarius]
MKKVAIITGISSGMGKAAVLYFKEQGFEVYGGARRIERLVDLKEQGIHTQSLDVTDAISVRALVDRAISEQGQIDVLVNNAGYGEFGPIEEVPIENAKKQFDVNVFGAAQITKYVLPQMRQQGSGRIVNISSVGSNIYSPLGGWYYTTKASLNMWSDVLDQEVKQFGIRSVIVQPGLTKSEWSKIAFENAKKNLVEDSPYENMLDKTEELFSKITFSEATAEDLAKVFYRAATDIKPKRRYYHSIVDHGMVLVARTMPNTYRAVLSKMMKGI